MSVEETILDRILEWKRTIAHDKPLIVGISGPQGCGKTTLVNNLSRKLSTQHHLKTTSFSADDFYLTFDDQQFVAKGSGEGNVLLQFRGLPGTHDVELGEQVLKDLGSGVVPVSIPVYDKSRRGGRGDRLGKENWTIVTEKQDVILFEGWFMGFKPQSTEIVKLAWERDLENHIGWSVNNMLEVMNHLLKYEQRWYSRFDAFVQIVPQQWEFVYEWRWQQEESMRKTINDPNVGLTRNQINDFVNRFIPVYKICDNSVHHFRHSLTITINKQRQIISYIIL